MVFEWMVYRRFRDKLRSHSFDLVHRISPISQTIGSPLAGMTKVPMLIGPLNGGLPWPAEFPGLRSKEREWLVPLRGLYRYLPYHRSTYRHIRGVITPRGSVHTATEIPAWYRGRRYYVPENGVDPKPEGPVQHGVCRHQRLVAGFALCQWAGSYLTRGFDLVLEAAAPVGGPATRRPN